MVEERIDLFSRPINDELHPFLDTSSVEKLIIVGDVHGCFNELIRLLTLLEFRPNDPRHMVVLLGDLINKGKQSKEVVEYSRNTDNIYAIKGNHEVKVLNHYDECKQSKKKKKKFKYKFLKDFNDNDIRYLRNLPLSYRFVYGNDHIVCLHAGIIPGTCYLDEMTEWDITTMRNVGWENGRKVAYVRPWQGGQIWGSLWRGSEKIYFGHASSQGLQLWPNGVTGLDTGCCKGHFLTSVVYERNENDEGEYEITCELKYVRSDKRQKRYSEDELLTDLTELREAELVYDTTQFEYVSSQNQIYERK